MFQTLAKAVLLAGTITGVPANGVATDKVKIIKDFSGNVFYLEDSPDAYSIYDSKGNFIEGSTAYGSPYFGITGALKYLGPGSYFVEQTSNRFVSLSDSKTYTVSELGGKAFSLPDESNFASSAMDDGTTISLSSVPNSGHGSVFIGNNQLKVINEYSYFQNLALFPNNTHNVCGLVTACMILAFMDTFYNDDFVDNDIQYMSKEYLGTDNCNYKPIGLASLISKAYIDGSNLSNFNHYNWSMMPSADNSMLSYLHDKYMVWSIMEVFGGHPMTSTQIVDTLENYVAAECENLESQISYYDAFTVGVLDALEDSIDMGFPVAISMLNGSYTTPTTSGSLSVPHTALAYGYGGGQIMCHMGWSSGSTVYSQTSINEVLVVSTCSLVFAGSHKHSKNVVVNNFLGSRRYACGCGTLSL